MAKLMGREVKTTPWEKHGGTGDNDMTYHTPAPAAFYRNKMSSFFPGGKVAMRKSNQLAFFLINSVCCFSKHFVGYTELNEEILESGVYQFYNIVSQALIKLLTRITSSNP